MTSKAWLVLAVPVALLIARRSVLAREMALTVMTRLVGQRGMGPEYAGLMINAFNRG